MSKSLNSLEKDIKALQKRNEQVDLNKAWETSIFRKILILVFTYIVILLYLKILGVDKYYLHAIVPAIGFILSTMVFSVFKNLWIKKYIKKHK